MMLIRLAWRNIWRNRRRSIIIIASVVTGAAATMFTEGLSRGFLKQMLDNQLGMHTGHVQIHARGFRGNPAVENFMPEPGHALEGARSLAGVAAVSSRTLVFGLLSSASNSSGVSIVGISPSEEADVTTIRRSVVEGRYLSGAPHEILISRRLAETLGIGLEDKVVAMASRRDAKIGSELFRVVGLFRSPSSSFDRVHVYVPIQDARAMLQAGGSSAEVVVLARDIAQASALRDSLRALLGEGYEVSSYQDLVPFLVSQLEVTENMMVVIYAIIGIAMIFGIINTMLMSVFERIREFGVLKAVGMSNGRLFAMIVLEALALGLLGTVGGGVAGGLVHAIVSRTGINFAGFSEGLASWGLAAVIYPVLSLEGVLNGLAVILLVCVLAAVYPAYRTVRLEPINAIRYV